MLIAGEFGTVAGKFNLLSVVIMTFLAVTASSASAIETICNTVLRAMDREPLSSLPDWVIVLLWLGTAVMIAVCLYVVMKALLKKERDQSN